MLRQELIVIIFNCASANVPFVPVAIKPTICNCEGTRTRAVTKFPKLTTPTKVCEKFGCCGTIRVSKISAVVHCDRKTFVFWQRARSDRPASLYLESSLLSPLLRLIDRDTDEETPNASERERIVFNQAREKENWKALEK